MHPSGGGAGSGEAPCVGGGARWEIFVPSSYFHYEPKTALKKTLKIPKKRLVKINSIH